MRMISWLAALIAVFCILSAIVVSCIPSASLNFFVSAWQTGALQAKAERGDAAAQTNLGFAYAKGEGVPKDLREAVRWYRKKPRSRITRLPRMNLDAHMSMARAFRKISGKRSDGSRKLWSRITRRPSSTLESHMPRARAFRKISGKRSGGSGKLRSRVARLPRPTLDAHMPREWGVPKDHREAVRWCRKAAEQGIATAQSNLGFAYAKGEGVPQDHREAVRWYRKAAEQDYAAAQFNLEPHMTREWAFRKIIGKRSGGAEKPRSRITRLPSSPLDSHMTRA